MSKLCTVLWIFCWGLWTSEAFFISPVSGDGTSSSKYSSSLQALQGQNDLVDVTDRRTILLQGLMASTLLTNVPSFSAYADVTSSEELNVYQDTVTGFQIKYPNGWTKSDQTLPDRRRLTLFINNDDMGKDKDLMFIAYTSVRDDFTSLGSFGSVEQVGSQTILPKGELMGEKTESEMLSSESKKNSYYFDYVSKVPNQPKRHFRTIFSLVQGATGGAGSVLVTITIQTTEDRYEMQKKMFDEVIDSYGKITS